MIENCIRCGRPTPYDINTPVHLRRYYVDGSGQLCEQCFSQLYSSSPVPPVTPAQQEKTEEHKEQEQIKTITLPSMVTPSPADQDHYNQLIKKPSLTDADREELARLYKKYIE